MLMDKIWRVGRKVPISVYEGDTPMFQCHTTEDALRIVQLLNDGAPALKLAERMAVSVGHIPCYCKRVEGGTVQACMRCKVMGMWEDFGDEDTDAADKEFGTPVWPSKEGEGS